MSCNQIAVALVCTVKSTQSQSNHSRISVELDSRADTCVVSSDVDVYCFDKETEHANSGHYDQPGYQDQ